ncbi:hypothetical protein OKA04_03875 [Luteolibacter flavescens]|uniref:DUF2066 domain-containing protein n=1 Tax=Luteolibacter flavescens TaxID=1859460 RepID=A0ABT3FKR8_9BACT|nr:hypothetical protein [Luteolibacter flavescens]MCW1883851.1 hypothetical protein [Luteolibacter flavescens]
MKALLLFLALCLPAVPAKADPFEGLETTDLCIAVVQRIESGGLTEKQATEILQKTIDRAKKEVEAYKPPDAKVVERLLAAEDLSASMTLIYSDGCTHGEAEEIRFTRKDDLLTVEAGETRRLGFSFSSVAENDKALRERFQNWQELVRQVVAAGPDSKWLAETTPEELLKRGRQFENLIGGAGFQKVAITLKSGKDQLVIKQENGNHFHQAMKWHSELVKALPDSKAKPILKPAAR